VFLHISKIHHAITHCGDPVLATEYIYDNICVFVVDKRYVNDNNLAHFTKDASTNGFESKNQTSLL
jgi:hypothetical protein